MRSVMSAANPAALEVGHLAQRLAEGYFAHLAALAVAADPRADELVPPIDPLRRSERTAEIVFGEQVPTAGIVRHKDGSEHIFSMRMFFERARKDPFVKAELERVWFTGALLTLGDALSKHGYFDRVPELEFVRHLRNGIAHGNRLRIDYPDSLQNYPAHTKSSFGAKTNPTFQTFEISPAVNGQPVLFDFMAAGDVLSLLTSVSQHLIALGNGVQPFWQR